MDLNRGGQSKTLNEFYNNILAQTAVSRFGVLIELHHAVFYDDVYMTTFWLSVKFVIIIK